MFALFRCTNRTTDIDSELVAFLQENPLMEEPVRPVSGEPVFRVAGASFRLTSIVGENAQWLNTDASTHFVLYTGNLLIKLKCKNANSAQIQDYVVLKLNST